MDTLKEQGLTNPIGLAAVAGTGQIESGWGSNVHRTWSDPSQSGQPGTSGLAMSWRDGRLKAAQDYAAANGDDPKRPSARSQASFFINEDPSLVAELQNAKDLPSAMKAINSRWKFAGYDTGGGSTGARFNAASNFLKTFGNQPLTAKERSAGVNAQPEQAKVANYDENGREYFELKVKQMKNNDNTRIWLKISELVRANPTKERPRSEILLGSRERGCKGSRSCSLEAQG